MTWGRTDYGGSSSSVHDQLKNVKQIHASERAFAAMLGDGSVVTWGHEDHVGDSSPVREQLQTSELPAE